MVFAGTCKGTLFGLKFIHGNMNSQMYQELVKEDCIPYLTAANYGDPTKESFWNGIFYRK